MGSLFKPSTTVVQAPSQQTVTSQIPEYFKEIQERTLRTAEDVFTQPYVGYTGQRVAQLSPQEQQVSNVFSTQILPQAGQLAQIGAQTFDTQTMQQYMNPYTNAVIQSTLSDLGEAYQTGERALSARAIGAGAFGGSREGVERALGRERYLDQVADTSARLRQAGFESGAQRFAADRAAQLLFNRTCDSSLKATYWNSADAWAYTLRAAHHFMCGTDTTYIRQALEDPFKPFTELPSTNEIMEISSTQATNIT